jgi:glycosyltransferase involved in cell wall biosynthesis
MGLRIAYVLDRPELGGGSIVVRQHAGLLRAMGHRVVVLGRGSRPSWWGNGPDYLDLESGAAVGSQDLVVATFWTTVDAAEVLGLGPVAHFCQGYEGEIGLFRDDWPAIERTYARKLPTLAVTPRLADLVRDRFGRAARVTPPAVEPGSRPRLRWFAAPRRRPWIAVPGVFEAQVKGVPTALAALDRLAASGCALRLLRLSVLPLSATERASREPQRYLAGVLPHAARRALSRCDLLMFPAEKEEGFGLPLLEALALGVPAVASRIPATEFISGSGAGARLVDPGDAAAMAAAAGELLASSRAWRDLRRAGLAQARRFAAGLITERLDAAVRWAASGAADREAAEARRG